MRQNLATFILFGGISAYGCAKNKLGSDDFGISSPAFTEAAKAPIEYIARFKDAAGLSIGSKVTIAGLQVGDVVGSQADGQLTLIALQVRGDVSVYSGAIIYKKMTSLLGEYYLELDPGGKATVDAAGVTLQHGQLAKGGEIVNVVETTSVDQLLRRAKEVAPNIDSVLLLVQDQSQ